MSPAFKLNEDDLMYLSIATACYTKQKYPAPHKGLPARTEIEDVIKFANRLFSHVCRHLHIDSQEVTK